MAETILTNDHTTELLPVAAIMDKIVAAERRLHGYAHTTPIHTSRTLDEIVGQPVFLKCENLQRVGAFKFRGAFNALQALSPEQRSRGVVTYSSGNHAQAMALAGQILDINVTVVMPEDAPPAKLSATRAYGANVVLYDPRTQIREEVAANLPETKNAVLIPPFDHYDVIAGQGTTAMELLQYLETHELPQPAQLLVPVGGGGLLAGCATSAHFLSPETQVIGVEPEQADDAVRSFRSGRIERIEHANTIADGTRTPSVGVRNFAVIQELVHDIVTVSEDEIRAAVRFLFERMKLVVEPSGALGIAALLAAKVSATGPVGVVISGGNVDNELFAGIISSD